MIGRLVRREKRNVRHRHRIILLGSKDKMTTISFRRARPSAWSRLVGALRGLLSIRVSEEWHWHGEVMRRRLADGTIATRDPTQEEIDDRADLQVW